MYMLESLSVVFAGLAFLILSAALSLSQKSLLDDNKISPFECGFLPHASHRIPFSLHFFLIGILFVVFDVELVLLFPYLVNFWWSTYLLLIFWSVLLILLMGLLLEWVQLMLDWSDFK